MGASAGGTNSGGMNAVFDVVIVGYGPSGATAANLLGQRGYRVAIVEQATAIYDKPRAITADHEVMRVFQACGLAEEIARNTCPHPGTDFVGVQGDVIKRFYPQPGPHPLGWEPTWMFVQPELEAVLRRGVERFPSVEVFLAHTFIDAQQDDALVHTRVRRLADDTTVELRSRYLIACDGARSAVRRQFDGAIEDLAFDEWWLVADAWLHRDAELPPRCVQYCRPRRPGTYIVGPGALRRWEIKLLPGETPEAFESEDAIRKVLAEFVDVASLALCRSAVYRFHALVARQWRFGRVFLMGDAAHQMPPFLGQGLCAGIRDTVNLVWKLDAVERQGARAALLDTYGTERTPHVRTIVSHAKSFGLIIGELDEIAARERDARMTRELRSGKAETVRQKFIPGLEAGLIDTDDAGAPRGGAGALFVQPWVRRDDSEEFRRLDDLLQPGFLLATELPDVEGWLDSAQARLWHRLNGQGVLIGKADGAAGRAAAAATAMQQDAFLRLHERDGVFGSWLRTLDAKVVVVRPDRYVYGTARTPAELGRLVAQLARFVFGPEAID